MYPGYQPKPDDVFHAVGYTTRDISDNTHFHLHRISDRVRMENENLWRQLGPLVHAMQSGKVKREFVEVLSVDSFHARHLCFLCSPANFPAPGPQLVAYPVSSYPTSNPPRDNTPQISRRSASNSISCSSLQKFPAIFSYVQILLLGGGCIKARSGGFLGSAFRSC
jgi:hypothetical protein